MKTILVFSILLFAICGMAVGHISPFVFAKKSDSGSNDNSAKLPDSNPDSPKEVTKDKAATTTDENNLPPINGGERTLVPPILSPAEPPNVDCNTNPDVVRCPIPPPPTKEPQTSLPRCDGSFQDCVTRNGDICKAGQGSHECECLDDMSDCPKHPSVLLPKTITPQVKPTKPDESCVFDPTQKKCAPDEQGNCPPGFAHNSKDQCFPIHKCPPGFSRPDNDESGACKPNHQPPICTMQFPNHKCPPFPHPPLCKPPFKLFHGKCTEFINIFINIHKHTKHITNNNSPSSMVTRNTIIDRDITVGQIIDGCKDVDKNTSNKEFRKSCTIFMAAITNYCLTHKSIANKDHNICKDPLYLKNVPQYIDRNNVNMKLFPATIYNVVP